MSQSSFVYVTYIRTTAETLWEALTQPEFTTRYRMGTTQQSSWELGAPWSILFADGRVADSGSILEIDPSRSFVVSWRHEITSELTREGFGRCTFTLEPSGDAVKLTVVHEMDVPQSKYIAAVSTGWPVILSSLKSLLETGSALKLTGP